MSSSTSGSREDRSNNAAEPQADTPSKADAIASQPFTTRYWTKVRKFIKDKPILHAFWTAIYFLVHPFRFASEVIQGNWNDKMKPFRFLVESYVIVAFFQLFVPWIKALDEISATESLTKTQKVVSETLDKRIFLLAFLASASAVHLLLGRNRFSYGKALSLFCYCWSAPGIVFAFVPALAWKIDSDPGGGHLVSLLVAIAEFLLVPVVVFYQIAPIAKVYNKHWLKTLGAGVPALIAFVAVCFIFGSIADCILPFVPDFLH